VPAIVSRATVAIDLRWWIFLHILGVLGFVMAHGVSVAMLFRVRKERDRTRIQELISFSGSTAVAMYVSLGVLLAGGIIAGFQVHAWGRGWIWLSLGLLIATTGLMSAIAKPYYKTVTEAVQVRPSGVPRKSDEELEAVLSAGRPIWIAAIGFGTLVLILWLMIFQPF